ncbi:MAG: ABC transporter permease [Lachnospiraceae bacterium]|nr:ABC transporter permease [Lachnospiraceae bacterium]
MKRFFTIYEFELKSYIKNKSFTITTILLAVLLCAATFLPRFIDMSDMLGIEKNVTGTEEDSKNSKDSSDDDDIDDTTKIGIVDEKGIFKDTTIFKQAFEDTSILAMKNETELKKAVKSEKVSAGFDIKDDLHYEYYVINRDMYDDNQAIFESLLTQVHQQIYCEKKGIDYASFSAEYDAPVSCTEKILGKDAGDNYWYCYALVMIIFMMIILYGVMVATSVTVEKSNRSIEVLVTSVDAKYLLFGKVFAGATAAVLQIALVLAATLTGYHFNHTLWGDKLDMILKIPGNVLAAFAVFGIGGFLFYAFLYGAMGALVSKTEDLNKSAGSLQMLIMIVYFIVMFQLPTPNSIIMKICSFLPFSSYSAMFVRIGMGSVTATEVITAAIILFLSIFGAGWFAARIYRMGTLRYGNPIRLTSALKNLKNN